MLEPIQQQHKLHPLRLAFYVEQVLVVILGPVSAFRAQLGRTPLQLELLQVRHAYHAVQGLGRVL